MRDDLEHDWIDAFFKRLKTLFNSPITVRECHPETSVTISEKFKISAIQTLDHVADIKEIMAKKLARELHQRLGDIPLTVSPMPLLECRRAGGSAEFKITIGVDTASNSAN